jgi:hypothetical protein
MLHKTTDIDVKLIILDVKVIILYADSASNICNHTVRVSWQFAKGFEPTQDNCPWEYNETHRQHNYLYVRETEQIQLCSLNL